MNSNVTNVETLLSNWFFLLMRKKNWPVLHAGKVIPPVLCHHFQAGQAVPVKAWAADCHRAVPPLQGGFPEPLDRYSRELWLLLIKCRCDGLFIVVKQKKRRKRMSGWWFILIIGIWILLQVYLLPKLGISTWLRKSCQLGDPEKKITESSKKTSTY